MNESLQSVLTALGNAVVNSIWQTGLIWLLVVSYSRFSKRLSPEQLSNISFTALITGFIAFIATFVVSLSAPTAGLGIIKWISNIQTMGPVMAYAAMAYVILLVIPIVKFAAGTRSIYRLRREGLGRVRGALKIFLLDASQYLGIKRKVKIFTSSLISSPLTIGFLKPIILLPVAMANQLSIEQAQAVILHELAHIRRNDYLQNLVTQIIVTILYFNPFARLLATMQNLEREKSADNWVMRFEYNNCMYAKTLLALARQNLATPNTLAVPISGKRSPLLERVEFLLGAGKRRYPSVKSLSLLCILMIGMFTCSLLNKKVTNRIAVYPIAATTQAPVGFQFAAHVLPPELTEGNAVAATIVGKEEDNTTANQKACTKSNNVHNEEEIAENIEEDDRTIAATPVPAFANHLETVQPVLAEKEENDIQEALQATKKIITELSWNAIDNSLAETVTQQEKQALKDAYSLKLETANWEKQAEVLRLRYNDINWDKIATKLASTIRDIKVDNIYKEYKNVAHTLNDYKKQLQKDSSHPKKEITAVNDLIKQYRIALQKIDSVRSKKVVEL